MKFLYKDNILNVKLNEELDVLSCKNLRTLIDGYIIKYQPREVILDLSEVSFMDSSGIGLLIGRYNLLKMLDSKMTILNPTSSIKRVLELSKINNDINMRCE